jgi:hypothetical protein
VWKHVGIKNKFWLNDLLKPWTPLHASLKKHVAQCAYGVNWAVAVSIAVAIHFCLNLMPVSNWLQPLRLLLSGANGLAFWGYGCFNN